MKQTIYWTTVVLLGTTLVTMPSSSAQQTQGEATSEWLLQAQDLSSAKQVASQLPVTPNYQQRREVSKVGEYQTCQNLTGKLTEKCDSQLEESIAKIYPHDWQGKPAATIYVRNIPVLMLIGDANNNSSPQKNKVGENQVVFDQRNNNVFSQKIPLNKVSRRQNYQNLPASVTVNTDQNQKDPVWRASVISAKLNQLYRDNVDANKIEVSAIPGGRDRYIITVNGENLVEINSQTFLARTTNNLQQDALQATNRLRRTLGDAAPLNTIQGLEQPKPQNIAFGPVVLRMDGWASWYGPGFDGNYSASGEVFNANDLTAAHPNLPFGTKVRVTNMDNGRSVVVRINDRGPYAGGRIIDLSFRAAQLIGMIQTGVAPVRLEVLRNQQ